MFFVDLIQKIFARALAGDVLYIGISIALIYCGVKIVSILGDLFKRGANPIMIVAAILIGSFLGWYGMEFLFGR